MIPESSVVRVVVLEPKYYRMGLGNTSSTGKLPKAEQRFSYLYKLCSMMKGWDSMPTVPLHTHHLG